MCHVAFAKDALCRVLCFVDGVVVLADVSKVYHDQPGVTKRRVDHAVCMLHSLLRVYCVLSVSDLTACCLLGDLFCRTTHLKKLRRLPSDCRKAAMLWLTKSAHCACPSDIIPQQHHVDMCFVGNA